MKDLYDLIEFSQQCVEPQPDEHLLALVVHTEGPAYRRAGARVLLKNGRKVLGTISGGCLEESLACEAERMKAGCRAKRLAYDSRSDADLLWGTATGCGGLVSVLLQRWESQTTRLLAWVAERLRARQPVWLATVIDEDERLLGRQLALDASGEVLSQIESGVIAAALSASAAALSAELRGKPHRYHNHSFVAGQVETLLEYIPPRVSLLIIGAGDDAWPLVEYAKTIGWGVTVVDHRPAYVTRARFPQADHLLLARPEAYAELLSPDPWTVAVVMTHNWHQDADALAALAHFDLPYTGIIGSVERTQKMLAESGARALPQDDSLYYPAGLDIGAQTPEEIALSLVAEIQAVLAGRSGESLKRTRGRMRELAVVSQAGDLPKRSQSSKSSKVTVA